MLTEIQTIRNDNSDRSRALQASGMELYRHDLSIFFLRHPDKQSIFWAEEGVCLDDEQQEALIVRWWCDLMNGRLS